VAKRFCVKYGFRLCPRHPTHLDPRTNASWPARYPTGSGGYPEARHSFWIRRRRLGVLSSACLTIRILWLFASGTQPQPVHKNEPRPTPGLLRISYLAFALPAAVFSAAAAMAEGSAKAITASPSAKLSPGLPPKP